MFQVEISTNNAAFELSQQAGEVARILRLLARRLETEGMPGDRQTYTLYDVNGNECGHAHGGDED